MQKIAKMIRLYVVWSGKLELRLDGFFSDWESSLLRHQRVTTPEKFCTDLQNVIILPLTTWKTIKENIYAIWDNKRLC